jgi:cAMP-dependent protein kinase regulator
MSNPQRELANRYLEDKGIKQILQRIVVALLEARPDNPERYIMDFLAQSSRPPAVEPAVSLPTAPVPPPASPSPAPQARAEDVEQWPSMLGKSPDSAVVASRVPGTGPAAPRRASYVSASVLSLQGSLTRRKGMSSKMTSSTAVEIRVVPKDPETFAQLVETVKRIDLFAFLQPEPRHQLVNAMFPISFKDGHVIIKQGAPPDNFYILNSGDCRVLKRTGDEEKQVALLHPGQYFGELALISGRARAATVIAAGDSRAGQSTRRPTSGCSRSTTSRSASGTRRCCATSPRCPHSLTTRSCSSQTPCSLSTRLTARQSSSRATAAMSSLSSSTVSAA